MNDSEIPDISALDAQITPQAPQIKVGKYQDLAPLSEVDRKRMDDDLRLAREKHQAQAERDFTVAPVTQFTPSRLKPNKYVDELKNTLIERLATNQDLKLAVAHSDSPRAHHFLSLLANPAKSNKSVTRLARIAGIEPQDLIEILRTYYNSQALMTLIKGSPVVAEHIVEDSKSVNIECTRCDGLGEIQNDTIDIKSRKPRTLQCPRCKGQGVMRKAGDADARKILAESVGWIKGKGVTINNTMQTNVRVDSVIDEIERLQPQSSSRPSQTTIDV